ncbi:MAG: hypothetical protein GXP04_02845 [Alphaproteobacteria bacterium]|nr:hypothetical protein [Alphaproteobacteria bacterium]
MNTTILVHPIFGFGWRQDGHHFEEPSDFCLNVREPKEVSISARYIIGIATQKGHVLDGMYILLTARTKPSEDTSYNLFVLNNCPSLSEIIAAKELPQANITGFALVRDI